MNKKFENRQEIDVKDTWQLEDIFPSVQEWEQALLDLQEPLEKLLTYKDKVGESALVLTEVLDLDQDCSMRLMELYAYAKMNKDLNNADPVYQAMYDRIVGEHFKMSSKTAFIAPALSKIGEETLRKWLHEEPALGGYAHYLDNLIRNLPHILSEKEEMILSQAGPMAEGIEEAFSMMNNLELDLGEIVLENGEKEKLTHGKFGVYREHKNRDIRSQAYEKIHTAYQRFGNTIAALYTSNVKGDVFFARTRGFETCLERALFSDRLPPLLYRNLIESIHDSLPSFYRYLLLRKNKLMLETLHLYDCSVPIVETPEREYSFEKARSILRKGLSPLGESYRNDMDSLFAKRSIDVYETPGKTSGAYAWGTYSSHPYMLLNWSGRLNDVFTFAHETGHCMHSFYSNMHQPYVNSHYPIFLAEIASTVNENILLRYMIENCDTTTMEGKKEKAYLVNYFLEGVKNTVFRQTMFAEFEWIIHTRIENGEPVTSESLCDVYGDLLKLYFGDGVEVDSYMRWEWARVPHFYSSFYVYKYATGFCAATRISRQIFNEGEMATHRYHKFLSSGGSDYPLELLTKAGVDITSSEAVKSTMEEFDRNLILLEELLRDIK